MRKVIWITVLLVLCPQFGLAQDSVGSWENLKGLRLGQKIEVVDTSFKKVNGRFRGFSQDRMSLQVKHKQELALQREQVLMVRVRSSWEDQFLVGLLAGALIGAEAWLEADRQARDCVPYEDRKRRGLSGRSAAIFAGAGAGTVGLAAAFSGDSGEVIYFHQPRVPYYEAPIESYLYPENAGKPEGGNVFAPIGSKEGGRESVPEKSPGSPD